MTEGDRPATGRPNCGEDAAAYVLGALEDVEVRAFHRHLVGCAVCSDEVAALQAAVDALPLAAPQLHPSRGLRRRVMRAARAEREARRHGRLGSRVRARRAIAASAVAAASAVVAVAASDLLRLREHSPRIRVLRASVIGVRGSAQLQLSQGRAELIVTGFPAPAPGDIYELWLQRPGRQPTPTSTLFSVTRIGAAEVDVPGDVRGVSAVLVTQEPTGGSLVPTSRPLIIASLRGSPERPPGARLRIITWSGLGPRRVPGGEAADHRLAFASRPRVPRSRPVPE